MSRKPAEDRIFGVSANDLAWGFDARPPRFTIGKNSASKWTTSVEVDPAPCYPHNAVTVCKHVKFVEEAFPIKYQPFWYLPSYDGVGGYNGITYHGHDYDDKDQHDRYANHAWIVLNGKRIPLHPAMTRYLVAHEYGHAVEVDIAHRLYTEKEPRGPLMEMYSEMRGMKNPTSYGPGTWHLAPAEVFANDFRILVTGTENEFWPHDVPHPTEVPAVVAWWNEQISRALECAKQY
jgi:hypothetical protein